MATYIAAKPEIVAIYGTEPRTAAQWQKLFHDNDGISFGKAAINWKIDLGFGNFKPANDAGKKAAVKKAAPKAEKKASVKAPKKAEMTTVGKEALMQEISENVNKVIPGSGYKKVNYQVSDPNDPHHYEFVKEAFDTEKERDEKIVQINKNPLLFYISKGWGDKKFDVTYWRQID